MARFILLLVLLVSCSESVKIPIVVKEKNIEPIHVKKNSLPPLQIVEKKIVKAPKPEPPREPQSKINMSWPAKGTISSGYGKRHGKMHHGIDITRDNGKNVFAAYPGIIQFSGKNGSLGRMIIIDHGNGIKTFYAHCSKLFAMKNSKVRKGQLIAKMGSSGKSFGVHLHFEIRIKGNSENPLKYLPLR